MYKQIDRLITKYLIIGILLVIVVLNHQTIFLGLSRLWSTVAPLAIGVVMAYVINLLMIQFENLYFPNNDSFWVRRTRRPVSILLSFIVISLVLMFILNLVLPQLISVVTELIQAIPNVLYRIQNWFIANENQFPPLALLAEQFDIDWQAIVRNTLNVLNDVTSSLIGTTINTAWSLFGVVFNAILSIMICIYVLMSKETLIRQFGILSRTYLTGPVDRTCRYILRVANESFSHFITGEVIEAAILGVLVTVGMLIFQFPYATMVGALTGVTALIPIFGAYLSGAVGFMLIFVQSPLQAFAFLIFIIVIQQFEGNVIYPRVVGSSIGLPGLWVLVAVTIGGGIWGIWGMLIAVPIASTFYKLVKNDVMHRNDWV